MIKKGNWIGYYSFSDNEINKNRGYERTNFNIEIISINEKKFSGTVEDDLLTGGTEGVGNITGKINGNSIEFVKRMPVMTLIVDKKGTLKKFNKKHPPIYYKGKFSKDGKTITGNWRFKWGIIWIGFFPNIALPTKGIWSMSLRE